jgi:KEOPS complex subunit Pcc1
VDQQAVFEFDYADPESARRVQRSVAIEVGDIEGDRSTATLDRDGATLVVTVAASDLVALRAGCNTWLSLVSVAETCGDAVQSARG